MKMPFTKFTLSNGMRVVFVPEPSNVATTILVLVEAGSKYETKSKNGLSHFLEHMCFKGTVKRPRAIDISSELDGLGAEYNAFTAQEYTGYYVKVEAHKAEQALEIIADLYLNPVFDPDEIEKEKGVIIEELNMYEDLPPRKVHDLFMETLYGDQPAGWNIGGRKEVIRRIVQDDFLSYRRAHYVANATTVVVAGAFSPSRFRTLVGRKFRDLRRGKKLKKVAVIERQRKPAFTIQKKKSDQTHLVLGCRAFSVHDRRRFTLNVLSDILGGGMSSRLFQRIREDLGAAYYVRAGSDLFTDHGYLAVSAGIGHTKLSVVVSVILEEFVRLAESPVPTEEIHRAKDHLIGRLMLGLETSDALAMYYGMQAVLRERITIPSALIDRINRVTAAEVARLARELAVDKKLNLAIIGPSGDENRIAPLLRFAYTSQ